MADLFIYLFLAFLDLSTLVFIIVVVMGVEDRCRLLLLRKASIVSASQLEFSIEGTNLLNIRDKGRAVSFYFKSNRPSNQNTSNLNL